MAVDAWKGNLALMGNRNALTAEKVGGTGMREGIASLPVNEPLYVVMRQVLKHTCSLC